MIEMILPLYAQDASIYKNLQGFFMNHIQNLYA